VDDELVGRHEGASVSGERTFGHGGSQPYGPDETVDEALDNLREALELYFEDEPLPDATEPPIIASVEIAA
jgi:hypothetical protein